MLSSFFFRKKRFFSVFYLFSAVLIPLLFLWGQEASLSQDGRFPFQKHFIQIRNKLALSIVAITPRVTPKKAPKKETFRERYWRLKREKEMGLFKGKAASGIIWDKAGHILTLSAFLPSHQNQVDITFVDGKVFQARIIQRIPSQGLAVLKLDKPYGNPIPSGILKKPTLGTWVATLGNSYFSITRVFQLSISIGRITGIYEVSDKYYKGLVWETDCGSGLGDMGGAVVDSQGRLMGILCPAFSTLRWMATLIPFPTIQKVMEENGFRRKTRIPPIFQDSPFSAWEKKVKTAFQKAKKQVVSIEFSYPMSQKLLSFLKNPRQLFHHSQKDNYYSRPRHPCSGVIVGPTHILTSWFNLMGVKKGFLITTYDGQKVPAKLIGWDANLDLALLKTEKPLKNLPDMGKSRNLFLGQWLLAIGRPWPNQLRANPYTLNQGILSALHRFRNQAFQTECRINWGNLGGGIFDMEGKLVGITVHLSSRTGNSSGVGFFIPNHVWQAKLTELKKGKKLPPFRKGYLGIKLGKTSNEIEEVLPQSPLAPLKLIPGDQILEVDGKKIQNPYHLMQALEGKGTGRKVKIKVSQGGKIKTVTVELISLQLSAKQKRAIK